MSASNTLARYLARDQFPRLAGRVKKESHASKSVDAARAGRKHRKRPQKPMPQGKSECPQELCEASRPQAPRRMDAKECKEKQAAGRQSSTSNGRWPRA